ncbi:hypothetical protein FQN54_009764 [Arachnomyces sp. PD_36]|nr:hypothetical protein FQN54_009764 [Arachnomyces sp. PD_36]
MAMGVQMGGNNGKNEIILVLGSNFIQGKLLRKSMSNALEIDSKKSHDTSVSDAKLGGSFFAILTFDGTVDRRVLKFWLLLAGGITAFVGWVVLYFRCASLWGPEDFEPGTSTMASIINMFDKRNSSAVDSSDLLYLDIWFSLGIMASIDATTVVLNLNRSLIDGFHYFVSTSLMSLAFIISGAVCLLHSSKNTSKLYTTAVLLSCLLVYLAIVFALEKLHTLLPKRGTSTSRGSLRTYSAHMSRFDLPWRKTTLYAAINGAAGFVLTAKVPVKWAPLNPVILIAFEITLLGLMGTKQTPRYVWFGQPVVQGFLCTHWGGRQVFAAPSIIMKPWMFLAVTLAGRLLLDLHLNTLLRHRPNLHRARKEVLLSTRTLVLWFAGMLLLEYAGVPVVTFIKPVAVVVLYTLATLAFMLPTCYIIAFDKIKSIRYDD